MTEGKGSTKSILSTVTDCFCFMGIAARKWIDTGPILEDVIKKVAARQKTLKFILLNPSSPDAERLSLTQYGNKHQIPELINDSLTKIKIWL